MSLDAAGSDLPSVRLLVESSNSHCRSIAARHGFLIDWPVYFESRRRLATWRRPGASKSQSRRSTERDPGQPHVPGGMTVRLRLEVALSTQTGHLIGEIGRLEAVVRKCPRGRGIGAARRCRNSTGYIMMFCAVAPWHLKREHRLQGAVALEEFVCKRRVA